VILPQALYNGFAGAACVLAVEAALAEQKTQVDLIGESTAAREAWRRRVVSLAAVVAVAFVGLVGQLLYLQVLEGGKLQEMSEKNRIRIRPVAAPR
jgi:hypothetical protein